MEEENKHIIELQPEGTFARKPDFHGKPTKVKVVSVTRRTNQWDKQEWILTFNMDGELGMIQISNKNVNFLVNKFDTDSLKWKDEEITLESVYDGKIKIDEGTDEEKEVEAYTLLIS